MIYVLIGAYLCLLIGILFFHYRIINALKANHIQKKNSIKDQVNYQKTQIQIRKKGLCNYDFLKYNLRESLLVQSDIQLF